MYSLGMRGSWCEKTFCRPTSHMRIFLLGFWLREFPITWNSMTPRLSSNRAASSRAEWAERRLVWEKEIQLNTFMVQSLQFQFEHCHMSSDTLPVFTSGPSMAVGSVMVDMTSLINSIGMSPTTRGRLQSSWDNSSEGFRFSPPTCVHRVKSIKISRSVVTVML